MPDSRPREVLVPRVQLVKLVQREPLGTPPPPEVKSAETPDRCASVAEGAAVAGAPLSPLLVSPPRVAPPRPSLSCCVSAQQGELSQGPSQVLRGIPWKASQPASTSLSCNECALSFQTRVQQARHRLSAHTHPPPLPCPVCPSTFDSRVRQRLHTAVAHRALRLTCPLCPARFPGQLLVNVHLLVDHSRAALLVCPLCTSACTSAGQLTAHVRAFHPRQAPLHCSVCPRDFDNVSSLLLHHYGHLAAMRRQHCAVCVAWFPAMDLLQAHERCAHGDPLRFDCPISKCVHHHHSAEHLSEHLADTHPKDTPYSCRCGVAFNGLVSFREHAVQTLHMAALVAQAPTFSCRVCKYTSKERLALTEHEDAHSGLLPLQRVAQMFTLMQDAKVLH